MTVTSELSRAQIIELHVHPSRHSSVSDRIQIYLFFSRHYAAYLYYRISNLPLSLSHSVGIHQLGTLLNRAIPPPPLPMLRPAASRLISRVSRRTWRLLLRIGLVILIVPLVLQLVIAYLVGNDARLLPPALQGAKNLLIVTAHPDDECLFFAPSILGVLGRNHDMVGGLLVMSTGKLPK